MLKVLIDLPVLERIRHYVDLAPGEVSALGIVERDDEDLLVTDLFLPKQNCSSASTDMDQSEVAKILVDLEARGIDPRTLRLWLHSHADMDTFWSGTDTATIAGLCNDGFVLSIVTNKHGKMLARVDIFEPIRHTIDKVAVEPLFPEYGLRDACKAEIEAKVGREILPPSRSADAGGMACATSGTTSRSSGPIGSRSPAAHVPRRRRRLHCRPPGAGGDAPHGRDHRRGVPRVPRREGRPMRDEEIYTRQLGLVRSTGSRRRRSQ